MNVEHIDIFSGENRTLTFRARDSNNAPVSLSGKTVSWSVGRSPYDPKSLFAIFTKTGTVTDAADGVFTVAVTPSDTQYLSGDYQHMGQTTDGSGNIAVVTTGRFRIRPAVVT